MNTNNPIEAAKEIIGQNREDDYILDPSGHAELFSVNSPEVGKILKSSDVSTTAKEFKHWDNKANYAQREFKTWSKRANWTVFLTACFSAGLLATGVLLTIPTLGDRVVDFIVGSFAFGSVLCGAFAAVCISRIRSGGLLEQWMQNRAEAETQRINYFNIIVSDRQHANTSSTVPVALLQLEYFRRFQLDVQLAYYRVRARQHSYLSKKARSMSIWAMGGVALVNGLTGVFGIVDTKLAAIAGVALVLQAFASKVTNTEAVNQDGRNAERYERTRSVLAKLSGKLDKVRQRILEGNKEVLSSFVEAVHEQLSLEHRQWLKATDERLSAIGKLEQHLKKFTHDARNKMPDRTSQ